MDAYEEGKLAFFAGTPQWANPYENELKRTGFSDNYWQWEYGYECAKDEVYG